MKGGAKRHRVMRRGGSERAGQLQLITEVKGETSHCSCEVRGQTAVDAELGPNIPQEASALVQRCTGVTDLLWGGSAGDSWPLLAIMSDWNFLPTVFSTSQRCSSPHAQLSEFKPASEWGRVDRGHASVSGKPGRGLKITSCSPQKKPRWSFQGSVAAAAAAPQRQQSAWPSGFAPTRK